MFFAGQKGIMKAFFGQYEGTDTPTLHCFDCGGHQTLITIWLTRLNYEL